VKINASMGMLCFLLPWALAAHCADFSGLEEFPGDLLRGAREEVRPEGLLTLFGAGGAASIARYGDTQNFDDFRTAATLKAHRPLGPSATDAGATIGYPGYLMAIVGTTYLIASSLDSKPAQEFGLLSFEALSLAGVQTLALKYSVHRLRPDSTDLAAFPSGHTSASFSVATVAASKYGWKAGVPAFLLASFVGYSRMEGNKHYLSDVLFGAGLGIASGRAVFKVRRRGHPEGYTFAPFVSPGGGGVEVYF
jgi:membrane-associated phospholipid phosphatase